MTRIVEVVCVLTQFVKNLFIFQGSQNPQNLEHIIKEAFIILHSLEKEGCEFNGTSGTYHIKKGWMKNPKAVHNPPYRWTNQHQH